VTAAIAAAAEGDQQVKTKSDPQVESCSFDAAKTQPANANKEMDEGGPYLQKFAINITTSATLRRPILQ
jgi:hypothetical protein